MKARFAPLAAALVFALLATVVVGTPAASAATQTATVVVQLPGGDVESRKVTFSGDSMSGIEALIAAGFDVVTYGQGPLGIAVCEIETIGCPADSSCLTCAGTSYWSYWRAPKGSTAFGYSPVGAGATQVRDGDVEGWRWGTGDEPPPLPRTAPLPTAPSTTSPAPLTTVPAPTTPSVRSVATTSPASVDTVSSTGQSTTSAPSRDATPKSRSSADTATTANRRAAAAAPIRSDDGGGSWAGVLVFAVLAAALLTWVGAARHRRLRIQR